MLTRKSVAVGIVLLAVIGGGIGWWLAGAGAAVKPQPPRLISVAVAKAAIKDVPYRIEAPGTVQPVVSVAIRPRVDSQVISVLFKDGAAVKRGELLFKLDARAIDAMVEQAEATLARDQASLAKAKRDVERFAGLVAKGTTSKVTFEDAQTSVDVLAATVLQDQANLDNLRAQRSYYDIYSPATGRIGISGVRPGTVVRTDSSSTPLATVNQMTPIYVAFGVPERYILDLRTAVNAASVDITLQNGTTIKGGHVAFIENSVDPQTGTIMVRALFDNKDERLWPGTLGNVGITLRVDRDAVVVPTEAVQNSQHGNFVFVAKDGVAKVQQITVARTMEGETVVASGLKGDETVITDGQLSLRDGAGISIKRAAGA